MCFVFSVFEESGVLQCVSVCCSMFQCVAVYGSTVPSTYREDSRLLFVLVTEILRRVVCRVSLCFAVRCSTLQCVVMRCSALQCAAVRCSVSQCIAQYAPYRLVFVVCLEYL